MKLLILTQKIDQDDDVLGFFHAWIAEFAKHCDVVTAIGLSVGAHNLPKNVSVFSLGKTSTKTFSNIPTFLRMLECCGMTILRLKYLWNFYRLIIRERKNYDAVFVHMNPEYVILGGIPWKMMEKSIGLWYAHGHTPWALRLAEHGVDIIFTSTESGFRLPSKKKRVVGQGIDVERFHEHAHQWDKTSPFRLVIVGRLSPVKDYETLLRAAALLRQNDKNIAVDIIGGSPLTPQDQYKAQLQLLVAQLGIDTSVKFHGAVPNSEVEKFLVRAHCFVNTSRTGSFDKAVGEAMATGLPILTSNEAFKEVLGAQAGELMFASGDSKQLAERVNWLMMKSDEERNLLGESLRERIAQNHSLQGFIKKILTEYNTEHCFSFPV